MPAKKKPSKEASTKVEVSIGGEPRCFGFFNRFTVRLVDGWVVLKLAHSEDGFTEPVFSGKCHFDDLRSCIEGVRPYIGGLGNVPEKSFPFEETVRFGPPVSFFHLAMLSSGTRGEVVVAQVSHHQIHLCQKSGAGEVKGVVGGAYQSDGAVHRRLAFEIAKLGAGQQS